MRRSDKDSSVGRNIASITFRVAPGIGWRLHMSKVAEEVRLPLTMLPPNRKRAYANVHELNMLEVTL